MSDSVKHVDAFIAPSRFSEDLHRRAGLNMRVTYLPHFVPPLTDESSLNTESHYDASRQPPYFLFVGRLEKLKGAHTLIPVFEKYKKAELWIAGTGSQAEELQNDCRNKHNIKFLGQVNGSGLAALYRGAVALIVPSLCFETFSLVIVEAFTQKTPAIVRNLGAIPEIIRQSGGGFYYNTDQELFSAMDALVSDPSTRTNMGRNGYESYERLWTSDVHLKDYLNLIEGIAAQRLAAESSMAGKETPLPPKPRK